MSKILLFLAILIALMSNPKVSVMTNNHYQYQFEYQADWSVLAGDGYVSLFSPDATGALDLENGLKVEFVPVKQNMVGTYLINTSEFLFYKKVATGYGELFIVYEEQEDFFELFSTFVVKDAQIMVWGHITGPQENWEKHKQEYVNIISSLKPAVERAP